MISPASFLFISHENLSEIFFFFTAIADLFDVNQVIDMPMDVPSSYFFYYGKSGEGSLSDW